MKYYTVCVFGTTIEGEFVRGCHIIKATSKKEALYIREHYGISNPRHARGNLHITCRKVRLKGSFKKMNLEMLERRRHNIGGSIWYVDENGNLKTETI